ncbi:MAG TPA: hypothetical protein VFJ91_07215 [Gaiellaceae bacterium]|nr:hypothetical protein [Gaiellaceae bacterium]
MAAFVDELEFGFGWIAAEPAFMRRCSHALAAGGRVWLLDPVWDEDALDRAAALGEPAGVVQLLDRHGRDCARVAERLGVPLHVVPGSAPDGAPFEVLPVLRTRFWREVALWFPGLATLVAADALGTAQYYRAPQERLAVSPLLRLTPPRRLLSVRPEHVLVGHGAGIHDDAAAAVREAVERARRRAPAWLWAGLRAHGPLRRRIG